MSFLDNARRAFSTKTEEFFDDRDFDEQDYEDYDEEQERRPLFSFLSRKQTDYDEYEEEYDEEPRRYSSAFTRERQSASFAKPAAPEKPQVSRVNMAGVELTVHYPEAFDDATKIIREVKANKITVFDISTITSDEEARRVVDYIGGAAEGMECPFKRLCPSIFCIAPKGVSFDIKKRY